MALIQYIGHKPKKTDNVAGTGLEWVPGQFHEVADPAKAKLLLGHPDVWAVLDREAIAAKAERMRAEEEAMRLRREQTERELAEAEAKLAAAEEEARKTAEAAAAAESATGETGTSSDAKAPADMEVEELRAHCAALGWDGHALTGKAKLLAWLQEQGK